tara:strand:+ start:89 stop:304 length:216 start_codon:yes stop_codon:yes gene_type:complete
MENYLIENYHKKIYELLDSDKYPLYLREHYSESPNWYLNTDIKNIIQTLLWMTYNKKEKEEILNKELIEYK